MAADPIHFLTDPVLRAPTLGCMLMCLASSLVGVVVFIRRRSLLGEALSHASYPGVVLSVVAAALFYPQSEDGLAIGILIGAFCSSMLGLLAIDIMERKLKIKNDAALCFVLSAFFGIGILIASRIQITHALWYKQIEVFLYGQAATMTDVHIVIYGVLSLLTVFSLFILYRQIEVVNFDRDFAKSIGIRAHLVDSLIFLLLILAIVIGIRSVGVVLMSGMLIAPAVAARQFTHKLWALFVLAGFFGAFSGFFGNYLSVEMPLWTEGSSLGFSLPTGPMVLISASTLCFLSLLFAPDRGLISRYWRIARFRDKCILENFLKAFWKKREDKEASFKEMRSWQSLSSLKLRFLVFRLMRQGWVKKIQKESFVLTSDGRMRAARIVRLHRLWEVYLCYLGQGAEKVHRNAEEMEHIITPELEKELIELLKDPKVDPHHQPIPKDTFL